VANIAELIGEMVRQAAIEGELNAGNTSGVSGVWGSGRLGANVPVGSGQLGLGASGNGVYIPKYKVKDLNVNRVDASYQNGNNTFGIDFDPNDARHNFMLNIKRNF
jgi:hypothetical protein